MARTYKTLVHEWFEEVWNDKDTKTIDRLAAADVVAHGLTDKDGNELRGVNAFKEFHRNFVSTFPDINVEVAATVSAGDMIVARCVVRGTHQGDGLGFKATGRKVEFTGTCIVRVSDGKFVEAWNEFDFLSMHRQLDTLRLLGRQE